MVLACRPLRSPEAMHQRRRTLAAATPSSLSKLGRLALAGLFRSRFLRALEAAAPSDLRWSPASIGSFANPSATSYHVHTIDRDADTVVWCWRDSVGVGQGRERCPTRSCGCSPPWGPGDEDPLKGRS